MMDGAVDSLARIVDPRTSGQEEGLVCLEALSVAIELSQPGVQRQL